MVGTGRFELPTPRTPSECSTRLSHVPTEDPTAVLAASGVSIGILHYELQPAAAIRLKSPSNFCHPEGSEGPVHCEFKYMGPSLRSG
jgi:hypothetical protein